MIRQVTDPERTAMQLSAKMVHERLAHMKPRLENCSLETTRKGQNALGEVMRAAHHSRSKVKRHDFPDFQAAWVMPGDQRRDGVVLYLHGGGYTCGGLEYALGFGSVLADNCGVRVFCAAYRLAPENPFPAAVDDALTAYQYLLKKGYTPNQISLCGESAGGGLCAAVCIRARDSGEVNVAFQMPLYPMLDDRDTESSRDNHGRVWNTRRNHLAWRLYLRGTDRAQLTPYAAPARLEDFSGLPPAYSFVGDGEPFYAEIVSYFEHLRNAGIPAELDVYHTDMHAFDMMQPELEISKIAAEQFNQAFAYAKEHYFAENL